MCDLRTGRTSWSAPFSRFFSCDPIAARVVINDFSEEMRLKRALQLSTPVLAVNQKPLPLYALQNECSRRAWPVRVQFVQFPRANQRGSKKDCVLFLNAERGACLAPTCRVSAVHAVPRPANKLGSLASARCSRRPYRCRGFASRQSPQGRGRKFPRKTLSLAV